MLELKSELNTKNMNTKKFTILHSNDMHGDFFAEDQLEKNKLILRVALWSIPLGYLASHLGWVVAEVGRQPWAIQDLLPVGKATSHLSTGTVQTTFWLFAILFTVLLIAEITIMTKQIKAGPMKGGQNV